MKPIFCKREERQFVSGTKFLLIEFFLILSEISSLLGKKFGTIKNGGHRARLFVKAFASSTFPRASSRTSKSGFKRLTLTHAQFGLPLNLTRTRAGTYHRRLPSLY